MDKKIIDTLMNPIRQRIVQTLIISGEATTARIGEVLSDVPRASLYRHIKTLSDAGVITVVKEEPHRGAVEKTYALVPPDITDDSPKNMNSIVQNTLMHISADFANYFTQENCDPQKDFVSIGSVSLLLSDEEYIDFITKYSELISGAMQNTPDKNRKVRQVTFISLPTNKLT